MMKSTTFAVTNASQGGLTAHNDDTPASSPVVMVQVARRNNDASQKPELAASGEAGNKHANATGDVVAITATIMMVPHSIVPRGGPNRDGGSGAGGGGVGSIFMVADQRYVPLTSERRLCVLSKHTQDIIANRVCALLRVLWNATRC